MRTHLQSNTHNKDGQIDFHISYKSFIRDLIPFILYHYEVHTKCEIQRAIRVFSFVTSHMKLFFFLK